MIITYSQLHRTNKYSQHSSIIRTVWLNGWVFVSKLSGSGFQSRCCYLKIIISPFYVKLKLFLGLPCFSIISLMLNISEKENDIAVRLKELCVLFLIS